MLLGSRRERVLALAELLMDTEQYDITREGPTIDAVHEKGELRATRSW